MGSCSASGWLAAFREERPSVNDGRKERLHLLESSADWSPSVTQRQTGCVIFDGILHNRAELAALFPGAVSLELSDADLVWHAYGRWGEDVPRKLKGIFALVIEDAARDLVLCARDPLGMYPLFYAEVGRTLLLSPTVEALLKRPGVSTEINRALLVDYLTRRWPVNDETYFAGVKRVPPGHIMKVGRSGRQVSRYWNPIPDGRRIDWIPDGEVQCRFEVLLEQAVARCLAPGPAGVYLSGGLDSSTVATVAADLSRREGQALPSGLSLSFPGLACDDTDTQRAVTGRLGLSHVSLPYDEAAGPEGTLAAGLAMTRTLPAPLSLIWRPALSRLARESQELGCRVVLSGDGADDWLLENAFMAVDFVRSLDLAGIYRLCEIYCRSFQFTRQQALSMLLWRYAGRSLLRDSWRAAADRMGAPGLVPRRWRFPILMRADLPSWIAPDRTLRARVAQRVEERFASGKSSLGIDSYYLRDARSMLDATDRWFMEEESFLVGQRNGIPLRQPFRDPDLIEFLVRVRPLGRSEDGLSKALVRRPLARRFPGLGFDRQRKTNLGEASDAVLSTQLERQWKAVNGVSALAEVGVVDPEGARTMIDQALAGTGSESGPAYAWFILNLEAWVRAHR